MKRLLIAFAAVGLLGSGAASACQLTAWTGGEGGAGTAAAEGPTLDDSSKPRYSGQCALSTTGEAYVQDNLPAGEARMISRFYVLSRLNETATIFRAFSAEDGTGLLYEVSIADGVLTVDASAAGGGSVTGLAMRNGWNSVEVDWASGGTVSVWLNSDAATVGADDSTTAGTGSIQSARLGAMDPVGTPSLAFDDYEARRTTAIGRLPRGDANGSDTITIGDVVTILREVAKIAISSGAADCNESGTVTIGDVVCALQLL